TYPRSLHDALPISSRPEAARHRACASRPDLDSYPTPRLVFVNGWFVPTFSTIDVGLNLHLLTIGEALRDPERGSIVAMHLGRYTNTSNHAFAASNTAFFTDGAYLEIHRVVACEQPIHLVFIAAGNSNPLSCCPRNPEFGGTGS